MTDARRVFFALWPDAPALDALDAIAHAGVERCGGRRMRRDSLHLTLAFIGAATPAQLEQLHGVAQAVRAAPFDLVLDRCAYWPHNRILWAGCHEPPSSQHRLLAALRSGLEAGGFKVEARPFVPHVTLVRHARCTGIPDIERPIRWQVSEFALVESFLQPSGARYRTLEKWLLSDSA